jgi:inner membrane protein
VALGLDFWTAAGFLMLGLILIVLEVFMPGTFIAVPGGALFLGGALALAFPEIMFRSVWAWLLWPVLLGLATLANLWFYKRWAPSGEKPLTLGSDSLPGEVGTVEKEILPETPGTVRVKGQSWSARTEGSGPLAAGAKVRVVRVEGIYAVVEPA